ncbi:hypothetical protein M1L60_12125 [Actinoplanes sp. TRM 88003]|uniref:Uncharacterized protein n=1 Tax=Paractinoplanes aksuensis TaxID=2939490 RepID=A0ABT1DMN3_9ACTN|nr:hypothetical protein [Actinoplanes aksuensis]MCO8271341.1 hypothetical protein [Actinoplanes aksuensis]
MLSGVSLILIGLVVAVVQLRRGDIGFGQLPGEDRETRRAVRRAIRDGHTDDARIDQLARRILRSTPRVHWAPYFFATMLVLSIAVLIGVAFTGGKVALPASQILLWAALIALDAVNKRRAANYRGLGDGGMTTTPNRPEPI